MLGFAQHPAIGVQQKSAGLSGLEGSQSIRGRGLAPHHLRDGVSLPGDSWTCSHGMHRAVLLSKRGVFWGGLWWGDLIETVMENNMSKYII